MKLLCTIALCLLVAACGEGPVGNEHVPEPAKPVDLSKYTGLWYEVARYENRFEKGCEAVTAEYIKRDDGIVGILNSCHQGAIDGPLDTADGKAKVVEGSNNTKLKVSFFGPFYFGNYWVLDHADDYSWSIVGEPSGRYLWILSRQPLSRKPLDGLVARAAALGYNPALIYRTKQAPAP